MAMSVGLLIGNINDYRLPVWMVIANGILYSFWFFGRSFINSKEKYPKLDKVILWLSFLMVAEIIIMAFYVVIFQPQALFTKVGIHYKIIILYSLASIILAIILLFKKDLFAKYFGFGAIIGSLAFLIGSLRNEGIILPPPFDPFAWGIFLQVVIYSFGIAYRQRTLLLKSQKEKLLAQQNLAEMQSMKDLDEIKSQFYTNISHEFRTPLSLIFGPLALARKSLTNKNGQISISNKTFEVIEKNTNRLQSLIDQILELSKLESGKVYLRLNQGNIIQFVKSITFSFESMAESQGISFNLTNSPMLASGVRES